jgi:hypothetical protein
MPICSSCLCLYSVIINVFAPNFIVSGNFAFWDLEFSTTTCSETFETKPNLPLKPWILYTPQITLYAAFLPYSPLHFSHIKTYGLILLLCTLFSSFWSLFLLHCVTFHLLSVTFHLLSVALPCSLLTSGASTTPAALPCRNFRNFA